MKNNEVKALLADYATGSLSREDEDNLMEAAWGDPDLYAMLNDMDELRQVFADPDSRKQIIEDLEADIPEPMVLEYYRSRRRTYPERISRKVDIPRPNVPRPQKRPPIRFAIITLQASGLAAVAASVFLGYFLVTRPKPPLEPGAPRPTPDTPYPMAVATPLPFPGTGSSPCGGKRLASFPTEILAEPLSEEDILKLYPPDPEKPSQPACADEVIALQRSGVLFIDARRTREYEKGHIAGALSMPVWESDIADRIQKLSQEGRRSELPIVLYCSGGKSEDTEMLVEKLIGAGFKNLLIYWEGWPSWVKRKGATVRGQKP